MIHLTHRYEMRDGVAHIVIYAYTPIDYEFATDFGTIKYNAANTANKIREYAKDNLKAPSNPPVMVIVNGVIIGSVPLSSLI